MFDAETVGRPVTQTLRVWQVQSSPVIACAPGDTLETAARLMWENDYGCIPVVAPDRKVVGMLTDRDLAMAAYTRGLPLRSIRVAETMARGLVTARAEESVSAVLGRMEQAQVRRVPVVDLEGSLEGIVSLNDLVREGLPRSGAKRSKIRPDAVLRTLAEVGRLRQT